jgi:hypothetical protein
LPIKPFPFRRFITDQTEPVNLEPFAKTCLLPDGCVARRQKCSSAQALSAFSSSRLAFRQKTMSFARGSINSIAIDLEIGIL